MTSDNDWKEKDTSMAVKRRFGIFLMAAGLSLLIGCEDKTPPAVERPVKAMRIHSDGGVVCRTFPSRTEATEEVQLAFRVPGQIFELPVNVGQRVEKGELIAQLDTRDYKIRVRSLASGIEEAKATLKAMKAGARAEDINVLEAELKGAESALNEAKLRYDRYDNLHQTNAVPKSAFDEASAGYDMARARVEVIRQNLQKGKTGARQEDIEAMTARIESLQAQLDAATSALDDTSLKAPFTGYISTKYVNNFQNVPAGQPIVKLQDLSKLEITVGLPEDLITRSKYFQSISCSFEAFPGRTFEARIKEIGTEASQQTQTYPVTVILDQPKDVELLPGMTADVRIALAPSSNPGHHPLELPATAVFTDQSGKQLVWVFDEQSSTVRQREVEVGAMTSGGINVLEGLKSGEWVVTAGVHYLQDGKKVRLLEDERILSRSEK
jgi:RND family efflux transporter MFP subunit